jgi:hypothetical protein
MELFSPPAPHAAPASLQLTMQQQAQKLQMRKLGLFVTSKRIWIELGHLVFFK